MNLAPETSIADNPPRLLSAKPNAIPQVLTRRPQWVVWRLEERDGEETKVPYDAKERRKRASSTDLMTWSNFEKALAAYERRDFDGLGFVLSSGDPFVAIDFDMCRNPETGEVSERVLEFISRFEDRYVEVSPSGSGLHLITRAKLREGTKKGNYEVYGQERFITMTGKIFDA